MTYIAAAATQLLAFVFVFLAFNIILEPLRKRGTSIRVLNTIHIIVDLTAILFCWYSGWYFAAFYTFLVIIVSVFFDKKIQEWTKRKQLENQIATIVEQRQQYFQRKEE